MRLLLSVTEEDTNLIVKMEGKILREKQYTQHSRFCLCGNQHGHLKLLT